LNKLLKQSSPTEVIRESEYNRVVISSAGSVVRFSRVENDATIAAIDLSDPKRPLSPSIGTMFSAALVKPNPEQTFNIGLGSGAFSRLFLSAFRSARLTTVEIDPLIVELAETYARYRPGPRDTVIVGDGRTHLGRSRHRFDWVVLDAFVRESEVPSHLTTHEFYRMVAAKLSDGGVFVANFVSVGRLFRRQLKTLTAVFPQVVFFPVSSERIIGAAVKYHAPNLPRKIAGVDIRELPNLRKWGVDFSALKAVMKPADQFRIPANTKVLSD
jgi:predicted O-methyltransferase YrrM